MSKKGKTQVNNLFNTPADDHELSMEAVAAKLYARGAQEPSHDRELQAIDNAAEKIDAMGIFDIVPDPTQPRRAVPSVLAREWDGQPKTVKDLFARWLELVADERGSAFPLKRYFQENKEDIERPEHMGPLETALLTVVELAASIKREGLINPISGAPYAKRYIIETGERRWLAYHLLHQLEDDGKENADQRWRRIPLKIVTRFSRWRQASEDNARQDLNAIGKARQFALLLMDLLQEQARAEAKAAGEPEPENLFRTYNDILKAGLPEQAFYAQVADGEQYRIPRGKSEMLLNGMGLKHAKQLIQYRALLRLPTLVWIIADDLNWQEGYIRSLVSQAKNDDDLLLQIVARIARKSGYTGTAVPVYDQLEGEPKAIQDKLKRLLKPISGFERINRNKLKRLSDDEKELLLDLLSSYEHDLKELQKLLKQR